jgi:hypothetical protein
MQLTEADPKGLIRESYAIEGITPGECRSIFLDWALSLADGARVPAAVAVLMARYGNAAPGHPMNTVLADALVAAAPPRRKGGRAGRVPD